jgi:hypothetical protein
MGLFVVVMFVAGFREAEAFRSVKSGRLEIRIPHFEVPGSLADPSVQRCGEGW